MTRELRANLIFFVVLVVLATPGFLLLMSRKLNGYPKPNDLPDPVPTSVAYMQPPPVDPRLPRREPRAVQDWVRRLLQARHGPGVRVMRDAETADAGPVVSDGFITQLAGMTVNADGTLAVSFIRWTDTADQTKDAFRITSDVGGRSMIATVNRSDPIDVPRQVRHALQEVGYIRPPERVWWLACTIPTAPGDPPPRTVTLQAASKTVETITLRHAAASQPGEAGQ